MKAEKYDVIVIKIRLKCILKIMYIYLVYLIWTFVHLSSCHCTFLWKQYFEVFPFHPIMQPIKIQNQAIRLLWVLGWIYYSAVNYYQISGKSVKVPSWETAKK